MAVDPLVIMHDEITDILNDNFNIFTNGPQWEKFKKKFKSLGFGNTMDFYETLENVLTPGYIEKNRLTMAEQYVASWIMENARSDDEVDLEW